MDYADPFLTLAEHILAASIGRERTRDLGIGVGSRLNG